MSFLLHQNSKLDDMSSVEESAGSDDSGQLHPHPHALSLQRMGSGGSIVLDEQSNHDGPDPGEPRKLPSSQYKGVVPQPNGRWGAQIYEKHHRVWLGTFDCEKEAAAVYDVAVCKFRGRDAVTNFAPIDDESELDFVGCHSKSEIVDMLRKHTYREELRQGRRSCGPHHKRKSWNGDINEKGDGREQLFEKTVTPSDVGKLNRLVIPKQYAEKHFPLKSGSQLLSFEDERGKVWRFRYSYWNSSQSYVLTKGWSRFVKEKGLKAGGVVVFQRSIGPEKLLFIGCKIGEKAVMVEAPTAAQAHAVRLFGVNIFQVPMERKEADWLFGRSGGFVKKQCLRDHLL